MVLGIAIDGVSVYGAGGGCSPSTGFVATLAARPSRCRDCRRLGSGSTNRPPSASTVSRWPSPGNAFSGLRPLWLAALVAQPRTLSTCFGAAPSASELGGGPDPGPVAGTLAQAASAQHAHAAALVRAGRLG